MSLGRWEGNSLERQMKPNREGPPVLVFWTLGLLAEGVVEVFADGDVGKVAG